MSQHITWVKDMETYVFKIFVQSNELITETFSNQKAHWKNISDAYFLCWETFFFFYKNICGLSYQGVQVWWNNPVSMYCYQFLSYVIYIYTYMNYSPVKKPNFRKRLAIMKKKIPYQQFYITISQFNCQASCTRVHGVIPVECYSLEKMNFKQNCNK